MKTRKTSIHQIKLLLSAVIFLLFPLNKVSGQIPIYSPDKNQELLNEPFDISGDFRNFTNTYYLADSLSSFDPITGKGEVTYRRYENVTREAFNNMMESSGLSNQMNFRPVNMQVLPPYPFRLSLFPHVPYE